MGGWCRIITFIISRYVPTDRTRGVLYVAKAKKLIDSAHMQKQVFR